MIKKSTRSSPFIILVWFLCSVQAYSQDYAIVHYNRSSGFPGNYCYGVFQDRQGYIWMSTENGIARFNGYEFKLFTTKDGLPDNEAFSLKEDSKGRIWFAPFTNSVGYIYNEKIYDIRTDSSLRKVHFKSRPEDIVFDSYGNIFFLEYPFATCLSEDGKIRRYYFDIPKEQSAFFVVYSGRFHVITNKYIFEYISDKFVFKNTLSNSIPFLKPSDYYTSLYEKLARAIGPQSATQFFKKPIESNKLFHSEQAIKKIKSVHAISPQILAISSEDGCYLVDRVTTAIIDTLLAGYNIGQCYKSADSSLWLSTLGDGVFHFIPSPIKRLELPSVPSAIQFIKATPAGIYCTLENGRYAIAVFDKTGSLKLREINYLQGLESDYPTVYIGMNSRSKWIVCGREINLQENLASKPSLHTEPFTCKEVFEENKNHVLIASYVGLARLDRERFIVTDTLLDKRTTSVAKIGDTIYAGTLQGLLFGTKKNNFQSVSSTNPSLNTRIVLVWPGDKNTLWIANNKAELIALRDNKIAYIINEKNGLQCNRISGIRSSQEFIWVGTDNGLYAFQNKPTYPIAFHFTFTNGLNSTQINCLDIQNGRVFVGTQSGINYFDERDITKQELSSSLFINSISNNGEAILPDTGTLLLNGKSLSIDFDIIDYTDGQKPLFQYRFHNEKKWVSIESSNLYFPELPFGQFTIDIRAMLPNWESSSQYKLHFYRRYPFYLQWWFIIFTLLLLLTIIIGLSVSYLNWTRKKDKRKIIFQRNLLLLEQTALQGQLNPHFIFNCMTAIKHHYNTGNLQKANEFIDAFAALIRQTFEMSSETFISLDKELNYLNRYLSIEQVRFDYAFDFFIIKDLKTPEATIPVPTMLLQPFVENAVRHGVRHLTSRRGKIVIDVKQQDNRIQISITDNGIGRRHKTGVLHRQMTSSSVNTKRLHILNQLFEQQIIYSIEDVINDEGEIAGTCIIVVYPLSINELQ